ncbi:MAG: DUF6785 family protein [Gemmatimonadota bacterium]|nr:DUF6785 family protein [Gemmatimonadota bacterium]
MNEERKYHPVTGRAACIGLALAVVIGLGTQYAADRHGYIFTTYAHLPSGFMAPFLLLILFPNLIFERWFPRWALLGSELITIFAMGLVASMMPDWGITRYMVSAIAAPAYFASPENRWDEYVLAHIPSWMYLTNRGDAARSFYEGLQADQAIPWGAWVIPLFWWLSLCAALLLVGACLIVVFRKQWVVHERLRFPLGEVALQLIGDTGVGPVEGPAAIWKNRIFQTGLVLTFSAMAWNCFSYFGYVPRIPITQSDTTSIVFHPDFPGITIFFNIYVLCFAFFAHAEILFSLWIFQLFSVAEQGLLGMFGIVSTSSSVIQGGLSGIQYMGGILIYVIWMVWISRDHLGRVWHAVMGRRYTERGLEEQDELISYRKAAVGILFGSLYTIFWLNQVGLSLIVGIVFVVIFFTFFLSLARVTAESGLVMSELTIKPNAFTVGIFGSANLSMPDLATLGMANGFARNWRTFSMIAFSHIAWFKNRMQGTQGGLFGWLCLAMGVSVSVSVISMVHSGYTLGASNMFSTPGNFGTFFYGSIPRWANSASEITGLEILFLISGMLLNGFVIAGRYLVHWWPLHPIGMAVGDVGGVVRNAMLPIFLAWLIQSILIRIGGVRLYRRAQPFFIGMLVGYILGIALSFAVDMIWFPGTPHETEWF